MRSQTSHSRRRSSLTLPDLQPTRQDPCHGTGSFMYPGNSQSSSGCIRSQGIPAARIRRSASRRLELHRTRHWLQTCRLNGRCTDWYPHLVTPLSPQVWSATHLIAGASSYGRSHCLLSTSSFTAIPPRRSSRRHCLPGYWCWAPPGR